MKIKQNSNNLLQKTLTYPWRVVPTLSVNDIRVLLIEAISEYKKNEMSLNHLVKLAKVLQKYYRNYLPYYLSSIIEEISTYFAIDLALTDMLEELSEMN